MNYTLHVVRVHEGKIHGAKMFMYRVRENWHHFFLGFSVQRQYDALCT